MMDDMWDHWRVISAAAIRRRISKGWHRLPVDACPDTCADAAVAAIARGESGIDAIMAVLERAEAA